MHASLLCEMQIQKRNEKYQEHHYEERQTGNARRLPYLWDQDVQNWKELIRPKEANARKVINFLAH